MNDQIAAIEAKTGNRVYVGGIVGTDIKTVWACVDDDSIQCRIQCPSDTREGAVKSLFERIVK